MGRLRSSARTMVFGKPSPTINPIATRATIRMTRRSAKRTMPFSVPTAIERSQRRKPTIEKTLLKASASVSHPN